MVRRRGKPRVGEKEFRAVTPPRTRTFEFQVATAARAAVPADWIDDTATFAVELHIYRARKTGDTDNFIKSALDGMNRIAWTDDEAVVEIHAYRYDDKNNPRLDVWVTKNVATGPS